MEIAHIEVNEQAHEVPRIRQEKSLNVVFSTHWVLLNIKRVELRSDHLINVSKHSVN